MNDLEEINIPKRKLWGYKIRAYFSKPENILLVSFLILLSFLILYPLFSVLYSSVVLGRQDAKMYSSLFKIKLSKGDFSLKNITMLLTGGYTKEYSQAMFWHPLMNSLKMSLLSSAIAILVGGAFAFLIARTDMKFKKLISTVFVFPYMMPSWTLAMVWKNVFINSSFGLGVPGLFENLTGICVPEWMVYGLIPCSIVLGIHYAPFAYILIGGILRNMDANLEEAATILKASRWYTLRRVTFPIVLPAVLSTLMLVFSSTLASYSVPNFLGSPGNFLVLSTMLKSLNNSAYVGQSYVMSIVLILFGAGFLFMNDKILGKRRSYTTVSGKSGQISYMKLGKWNIVISVILLVLLFFMAIFPMISFALESLCAKQGDYSVLTLKYWISKEDITDYFGTVGPGILRNKQIWSAMWGSIKLSTIMCLIVGTAGFLIGYAVSKRRNSKLANSVSSLAFFPHQIPTMAFGAIWLAVSARIPALKGTLLLLILAGSVKFLPFASRTGVNAMMQLSGEIEEAAVIVGAPWYKRVTKIIFPIQKTSFISGYLLPFISCMRELSLFVLLADNGKIITTLLSFYDEKNFSQMSNGINLMIIVVVLSCNLIVNKVTGASIDKGIGGN